MCVYVYNETKLRNVNKESGPAAKIITHLLPRERAQMRENLIDGALNGVKWNKNQCHYLGLMCALV